MPGGYRLVSSLAGVVATGLLRMLIAPFVLRSSFFQTGGRAPRAGRSWTPQGGLSAAPRRSGN